MYRLHGRVRRDTAKSVDSKTEPACPRRVDMLRSESVEPEIRSRTGSHASQLLASRKDLRASKKSLADIKCDIEEQVKQKEAEKLIKAEKAETGTVNILKIICFRV